MDNTETVQENLVRILKIVMEMDQGVQVVLKS